MFHSKERPFGEFNIACSALDKPLGPTDCSSALLLRDSVELGMPRALAARRNSSFELLNEKRHVLQVIHRTPS